MSAASEVEITVVIPTFNGADLLAEVLDAVAAQRVDGVVETLVIDSGSTDGTLDIVRARPNVRLHEIPNSEFGHGRTRNLGARMANGRLVAFLTQDATPASDTWLRELTRPLDDPRVAGVVGRQIPRPGCFPLLKYEIQATFRSLGPDEGVTIAERAAAEPTGPALDRLAFYSDVNAATRRAFLVDDTPYRDLPYSEDMAFGRDIIRAGHRRAYAAEGAVIHSNELTRREYGKRIFDETTALRRIGIEPPRVGRLGAAVRATWGIVGDALRIVRDPDFTGPRKAGWLLGNPAYQVTKWRALRRASSVALDDDAARTRHSLEAERTR
jgi:rhamnosyltransferase